MVKIDETEKRDNNNSVDKSSVVEDVQADAVNVSR